MLLPEHSSNRQVLLTGTDYHGTYQLRKTKLRLSLQSINSFEQGLADNFLLFDLPSLEPVICFDVEMCCIDSFGDATIVTSFAVSEGEKLKDADELRYVNREPSVRARTRYHVAYVISECAPQVQSTPRVTDSETLYLLTTRFLSWEFDFF